jgi:hypothetical protein
LAPWSTSPPATTAAQAAPAELGDGGGLDVVPNGRARRAEALAQEGRQLELLPARHVRSQLDAVLVEDAGAHRRHRHAAAATVARGGLEQLLGARGGAIDGLDGAGARVGLEPVGLHHAALESGRGEGDLRAPEVDAEHEVARVGASGSIRHVR